MYNFCCFPVDPVLNSPEQTVTTEHIYTNTVLTVLPKFTYDSSGSTNSTFLPS